jgi:DNA polymerase I-like protein with 3'-5' exonuclease and polymerase domains
MEDEDIPVDATAIMASMGTKQQKDVDFDGLTKPWMKYHDFKVVQSIEELRSIVDEAFKTGKAALDLETEGLDTRVYMHAPDQIPDNVERPWGSGQPSGPVPLTVHKIVGYCLSTGGHTGYYVPVRHRAKEGSQHHAKNLNVVLAGREIQRLCEASQPILEEEGLREDPLASPRIKERGKVKIFFWNAKFDQEMLYPVVGIDFWHPESFEDGMLMYFTRYTGDKGLSLKKKSKDELWVKDEKGKDILENNDKIRYIMIELKELFPKGRPIDFPALDPYEARHYACSDAICTFLHCDAPGIQEILTNPKYNSTYRLEKQVTQVVRVMERHRIRINVEYVRSLLTEAREEALGYRNQIVELAAQYGFHNFDPQSPKQISDFLFSSPNGLKIEPKPEMNEKSGQYKTDADTLEGLVENNANINPVLLTMVKYRQVEKVIGTYLESMINNVDHNNDLRYQWKQHGAATGRFSSPSGADMPGHGFGGVPMHGIPGTYDDKKPKVATCLREAFVAREGYVMAKVDYAGQELRIATNLSGEPVWTKEFLHGTGDLHTITAKAFFGGGEVSKQQRQMGKCVHPSTLVFVDGVLQPLSSLKGYSDIEDTFTPTSGTILDGLGYQPLTALYNGGSKPLFHVVTTNGVLTCTEQHRFAMADGTLCPAIEMKEGGRLQRVEVPLLADMPYDRSLHSLNSYGKRVPDWVPRSGRAASVDYLKLLFDREATLSVGSNGDWKLKSPVEWVTTDLVFAGQVSLLLRSCGIAFSNEVTSEGNYKLKLVEKSTGSEIVVLRVIPAGVGPCVDVSVGNPQHLYIANGILTHNTANFALIYGGGTGAVMRATGCNKEEGARRKQNFDRSVPVFAKWVSGQKRKVKLDKGVKTAFGRWIAIPEVDSDNQAVAAGAERMATNYPTQGSGADIMKIAMVKILKECHKRGWRDVVHMMLTVHDELVFEIKQEYIMQVMPIIDECMTLPSRLVKWKVPLIAEPLLGKTWDAKYDYEKMMHGAPYKEGGKVKKDEVIVNGRLYQQVPDWLEPFVIPSWKQSESGVTAASVPSEGPTPPSPPPMVEAPALVEDVDLSGLDGEIEGLTLSVEDAAPKPSASREPIPVPEASKPADPVSEGVLTLGIHTLTAQSARLIASAITRYGNDDGVLIRIVDTNTGEVLISEEQGFRVSGELFRHHVVNEMNI